MTGAAGIDWSILEDHVVGGVFSPPTKGTSSSGKPEHSHRHRPNKLRNEIISVTLFSYNATTKTFKSSMRRLRAHTFCSLITLHNEKTNGSMAFELRSVTRNAADWRVMEYWSTTSHYKNEYRLVILNTETETRIDLGPEIQVYRDGTHWIAKFRWSEGNKDAVKAAGFKFCAVEKRWHTQDPHAASIFDPDLRAELVRQRESLQVKQRRPIINVRRWSR